MAKRNSGFSLVEVLITIGLFSFFGMVFASVLQSQRQQIRALIQKQESVELKDLMQRQLSRSAVCTWQLKDKVIDVSAPPTQANPSPTVLLFDELYQGEDASSALIAKANDRLPGTQNGLKVSEIRFRSVYATGNANEYAGVFEVDFDPSSLSMPMRSVQFQRLIRTVPTDPDNAKRIDSCVGTSQTNSISACPAGWTMIGDAGQISTYCIETNERAPLALYPALDACRAAIDSELGRAHLCDFNEWYGACTYPTPPDAMTGNWEWVAEFQDGVSMAGQAGCADPSKGLGDGNGGDRNQPHAFRCCIK